MSARCRHNTRSSYTRSPTALPNPNSNSNQTFWTEKCHTGYSRPADCSHRLWFFYTFFWARSPYETKTWTDRRIGETKDVLCLVTRLVAYWPAPTHAVAHANQYCRHVTSCRLAVCYSQLRSILSSATAFPTATLRWQQSRYRTINGKKLKPAILWS